MFVHRIVHHYLSFKAVAINTQGSSQRPTQNFDKVVIKYAYLSISSINF